MSVKESIIGTVAIVAVALIGIKLISTVEISPFVWTPLKMVSGFLLAVMALGLIAFAFMNAAQESGGEKRPAFLAAGATLIAMLAFLIQNAVEFQTASQAYRALGISAALLALAGVCLWQLQSARRRGMPRTARSYLLAAFLPSMAAIGNMLEYLKIALTPFPHTEAAILLYAPMLIGFFWMGQRLEQIGEAQDRMSEQETAK